MDACAYVEDQVRRTVRETGVDPVAEQAVVRLMVDDAVAVFIAACADGTHVGFPGPLPDTDQLAKEVGDAVVGLGPLQRYLDDPAIEEIWINEQLSACWALPLLSSGQADVGVVSRRSDWRCMPPRSPRW